MNGRLLTDGARPALRFERRLAHPVERVWRALTDPDDLRHWSPAVPKWTLEPGATFAAEGLDEELGRILEVSPPHLLVYTWGTDRFCYELRPQGDGCLMIFVHAFDDRDLGAQTAAGWDVCLDRLDALLAGTPLSERESLEGWPQLHERYAAAFGIDPEIGRRTFEQHMTGD